jgi:hypothetical protein
MCRTAGDLRNDRRPFFLFALDKGRRLGSRHRPVVAAEIGEPLFDIRITHGLARIGGGVSQLPLFWSDRACYSCNFMGKRL